jgi:hypothetical protein
LVILKKQLLILALLAAIALAPAITPVAAAPHAVSAQWLSPVFSGTDAYFDTTVIAYKAESTAKMLIRVYNDYATASSDMKVKVWMDWAASNVTSEEVTVEAGQYHTFEMSISIPATSVASNLYLHGYVIYYVYTTNSDPPSIIDVVYTSGNNFAVYSAYQTEIVDIKRELDAMGGYGGYLYLTANARELLINANVEKSIGAQMYDKGEFESSLTNYQNALNYTKTGISTDIEKMTLIEDTLLGVMDSMKGSMSMIGYGSLLFGIGFLFIGIGVIIYSIRKPRSPA